MSIPIGGFTEHGKNGMPLFGLESRKSPRIRKTRSPRPSLVASPPAPRINLPNSQFVKASELYSDSPSFREAAKKLAGTPVRSVQHLPCSIHVQARLELHLKAFVLGEGANFLATEPIIDGPDPRNPTIELLKVGYLMRTLPSGTL
jgi:hypothetical protein